MQPDLGSLWRHELLRRVEEAQRAEAAARPSPPPASTGLLAVWWQRARDWSRVRHHWPGRLAEVPVVELDLTDGQAVPTDALRTTTTPVPEARWR
jgi:hypothetical protein